MTKSNRLDGASPAVRTPEGFTVLEAVRAGPVPPTPQSVLAHHASVPLRRLAVTVNDDEVVITGCVSSDFHRLLAQESVRPTIGSRRLTNRVEVVGE